MRTSITAICLSLLILLSAANVKAASADTKDNILAVSSKKFAVVTLVTTSLYVAGAEVLAESLNRVNATGDRILLWVSSEDDARSDITGKHLKDLQEAGWKTIQLTKKDGTFTACRTPPIAQAEIDANPQKLGGLKRYWSTCSKFAVWTLTDYNVLVYMDADSIALKNFDIVYDLIQDHTVFAAQGQSVCWEEEPSSPDYKCDAFYTAFMVIKPLLHVGKFLKDAADNKVHCVEGELPLLNQVIKNWKPLPRYTLVAQTEAERPMINSTEGLQIVDWDRVAVYDFAGRSDTKPWVNYNLQKETGDKFAHAAFNRLTPEDNLVGNLSNFHRYMHPQWIWNSLYDAVLKRKERSKMSDKMADITLLEL
jgi:hypothetical protein